MSQPAGDTSRRNVPFLPPELSLRIIEESEEASLCLVNHLSKGKLLCDGFQNHTTVIYTRGEKQKDGSLSRGRLETLPMQHRCVTGVIRVSDTPVLPFDRSDDYSVELEISHLTKRTVVAELGMDRDIATPVLNLDKHAYPPHYDPYRLFGVYYLGYALLDRQFIATLPVEIGGGEARDLLGITRNQTALTRRLRPDDEKLACEKIKHLMIRENSLSDGDINEILHQLKDDLVTVRNIHRWSAYVLRHRYELQCSPLCPKWELLKGLETLCIDMTAVMEHPIPPLMGIKIKQMARCLNLKTLILLGVPCLARYDFQTPNGEKEGEEEENGQEAWVAYLEDNIYFRFEGIRRETLNYLYLFKDLVRPGGQIHFISDEAPCTPYWPGPDARVEPIEEGLQ
ncbi:hypothetical protein FGADI_2535 [Fusarium gaditjirri]|uniref:Uncharacterized protein n=1 Tax=Fusarium gaditjirri TaxID=282569 RepID=A0A8H4X273_9HYPO|nr:hypothetical protein FGADI_2535 [Fusarium gaditjirri]